MDIQSGHVSALKVVGFLASEPASDSKSRYYYGKDKTLALVFWVSFQFKKPDDVTS